MPVMAKVISLNLTGPVFFKRTIPFQKKLSAYDLSSYVLSAYFSNRISVYFCCTRFTF